MYRLSRIALGLAVVLAGMALVPVKAVAKKRVVVLYFTGDKKATKPVRNYIRYVLLKKVEAEYEEVSKKEIAAAEGVDVSDKAARKDWWLNKSPEQLAELAKKYSISVFILGDGTKKGRVRKVTISLFNGNGFSEVAKKEFTFRRIKKKRVEIKGKKKRKIMPDPKTQDDIGLWLLENMEKIPEYVPEEEQVEEQKPVEQVEDKEAEEVLKEPVITEKKPKKNETVSKGPWKLEAGISFDLFTRDLEFDPSSEPYLKTTDPVVMPRIELEAYPLLFAMKADNPLTGLGVTLDMGAVFGMKTHPKNDTSQEVDTTVSSFGIGLAYRYRIGPVWLAPRFEYRRYQWTYKTPSLIDSPGVEYSYLEPSFGAVFETLNDKLIVDGRFGLALPLSVGDIADGTYYGQATAYGMRLEMGVSYMVLPELKVGLGFRWFQMNFDFDGNGLRSANSATDSILSTLINIKYRYR